MLRRGRSALRSLARDSWKVAIGAAVGVLAGGALVWGDGGDASLVHACTEDGVTTRPNTIIVGPSEPCPTGFTPKHWNVQGPPGAQGSAASVTPDAVADATKGSGLKPPSVKPAGSVLKKLKIKLSNTKTVKFTAGPSLTQLKTSQVICPPSHPKLITGGFSTTPKLGQIALNVIQNSPLDGIGWRAIVLKYGATNQWALTASATCKK